MSDLATQIQQLLLPETHAEPVVAPAATVDNVPAPMNYSVPVPSGTAPSTAGTVVCNALVLWGVTFVHEVFGVDYGK